MSKLFAIIFFVFTLIYSNTIEAQKTIVSAVLENHINKASSDTIYYDFDQKLDWKDFQGTPGTQAFVGAITASGFAFHSSMDYSNNVLNIRIGVYTFFTKHDSWKKKDINSDYHLEHEQHHFDITRLGAQQFLEEIQKANFTVKNYQQLMNSIFSKVYDQNIGLQQQYDRETKNSMDVQKQMEWNRKIADQINTLRTLN